MDKSKKNTEHLQTPHQSAGAWIPAEILFNDQLSANDKLIYAFIQNSCNKHGTCWASNHYFSKMLNVSRPTITKSIQTLADLGYVTTAIHTTDAGRERIIKLHGIDKGGVGKNLSDGSERNLPMGRKESFGGVGKNLSIDNITVKYNSKDNRGRVPIEERYQQWKKKIWDEWKETYTPDFLKSFCEYWGEYSDNGRKMKWEKQKTFNTNLRLKTFMRNGIDWGHFKESEVLIKKKQLTETLIDDFDEARKKGAAAMRAMEQELDDLSADDIVNPEDLK